MRSYKELTVWKKSYQLAVDIYKLTKSFPKEEQYGLVMQMRRAVIAIPSNIAEGYNRQHRKEYIQFLYVGFSSGAELETQLLLTKDLGYISRAEFAKIDRQLREVMRMLNGLIRKLKNKS